MIYTTWLYKFKPGMAEPAMTQLRQLGIEVYILAFKPRAVLF